MIGRQTNGQWDGCWIACAKSCLGLPERLSIVPLVGNHNVGVGQGRRVDGRAVAAELLFVTLDKSQGYHTGSGVTTTR